MTEYQLVVKTVDGNVHKVKTEDESAELASLWIRNTEYGNWFEYTEGETLKYINRDTIVSIDVVDVKAEEVANGKRTKETLEAFKRMNS